MRRNIILLAVPFFVAERDYGYAAVSGVVTGPMLFLFVALAAGTGRQ